MRRVPLLAVAAVGLVACADDDDAADTTDTKPVTSEAATTTEAAPETTEAAPETTAAAPETTEAAPETTEAAPETTGFVEGTIYFDAFTFTPPTGDFSVAFPAEPTPVPQEVTLPADGRTLPIEFWIYESGGAAVGASRLEYPADIVVSLQGAADGAVANVGGTLTSSEPITLQGREGLRLTADAPSGSYLSEIYVDGQILYQLIAVVQGGEASFDDAEAAAFFGSFQFTEGG